MNSDLGESPTQKFRRVAADQVTPLFDLGLLASIVPCLLLLGLSQWFWNSALSDLPLWLRAWGLLWAPAFIVARFAIPARNGRPGDDLYDSVDYSQVLGCTVRLAILNALWVVPLVLWMQNLDLGKIAGEVTTRAMMKGTWALPMSAWGVFLSMTMAAVAPPVIVLVGVQAHTWSDLTPDLLLRVVRKHRPEALLVLALGLGAFALSFLLFLPVHSLLILGSAHWYTILAKLLTGLALGLPAVASLILLGRLAGVFSHLLGPPPPEPEIWEDFTEEELAEPPAESPPTPVPAASIGQPTPEAPIRAYAPEPEPEEDWAGILTALRAELERNPAAAAKAAATLIQSHEGDPDLLCILVLGHAKSDARAAAMGLAPVALSALIQAGRKDDAADLFKSLGKERHVLALTPDILRPLGRVFQSRGRFREAGWCVHQANLDGQDGTQDRALIDVAEAAALAHQPSEAIALYEFYLRAHPEGPFRDFALKAIDFQKNLVENSARSGD